MPLITCKYLQPYHITTLALLLPLMMMVLCPKAGCSLAFTPPGDEMSEVVSRCLPHRQLWVSNLSKVHMQWLEIDSTPLLPLLSDYFYYKTRSVCIVTQKCNSDEAMQSAMHG